MCVCARARARERQSLGERERQKEREREREACDVSEVLTIESLCEVCATVLGGGVGLA